MYNVWIIFNLLVVIFLVTLISVIGLDMKEPYPRKLILLYSEPYIRFFSYFFSYVLWQYNNTIALLWMIGLVLLQIDFSNLVKH
jgi:hypothetical protein